MKKKTNWLLIIGLSLGGTCLIGCVLVGAFIYFYPSIYQYTLNQSSLAVGESAPDFELSALTGETIRLSQFRGQPVLLNISATWCPDCRAEVPVLEELHRAHPELIVLSVDSQESPDVVQSFADEFGITYPVLLDRDGNVSNQYRVYAIPTGLFIDKDGVIQAKLIEGVTAQLLAEYLPKIGVNP